MTKDELEIIKKVKEVMVSYQTGAGLKFVQHKATSFAFKEQEHNQVIALASDYYYDKLKPISNNEAFEIVDDYFKNGGKQLKIVIEGKVRYNSLVNILLKKKPTGEFLNMFVSTLFRVKDNDVYEDALVKINKHIKANTGDADYGKVLAFKILSEIGKEGQVINNKPFFYSVRLPSICNQLSKFKIDERDYPNLHHLFNYFEESIDKEPSCRSAFIKFLKDSIPSKDWEMFKVYLNDEKAKKPQSGEMFEEKPNPKYQLNINEDFVTKKYPVISLSSDYTNMMSSLMGQIKDFKEELGLQLCEILPRSNKITSLYFLSKDENPVDGDKIKKVLTTMIGLYTEMMANKTQITKESLNMAMRANILAIDLERGSKEENQQIRKANKI